MCGLWWNVWIEKIYLFIFSIEQLNAQDVDPPDNAEGMLHLPRSIVHGPHVPLDACELQLVVDLPFFPTSSPWSVANANVISNS